MSSKMTFENLERMAVSNRLLPYTIISAMQWTVVKHFIQILDLSDAFDTVDRS